MKNFLSKKFSLAFASVVASATPFVFVPLTSCSGNNAIQFANFESYMDNGLMRYLENKYGAQFQWYTVTEMIETKFQHTYDIAAPSGYELSVLKDKGWLTKIDWKKFNIPGVEDGESAKLLFAEPVREALNQMERQLGLKVLDYGIPYFAQSFMFVYKGDKPIDFYENGTETITNSPTWADIFYTISPLNKHLDSRFNGRIGMIDDSKSIYDVSRIVQTTEQHPDQPREWNNSMPKNATIDDLLQTFKVLTNKAKSNWYTLNTDSGVISRNLADHGVHGYTAALTWSGDALYAAQGAGEFEPYTGDKMFVQKPYGASLDEIEFLVINNKNEKDKEKLDNIYKLIYDVCLDAYDATPEKLKEKVKDEFCTGEDRYKLWSMQNWDTVSYTPILDSIYSYVIDQESDYWDDYCEKSDAATRRLYTSILKTTDAQYATSLFGNPLTPLQNSNTHWAWLQSRGNL